MKKPEVLGRVFICPSFDEDGEPTSTDYCALGWLAKEAGLEFDMRTPYDEVYDFLAHKFGITKADCQELYRSNDDCPSNEARIENFMKFCREKGIYVES